MITFTSVLGLENSIELPEDLLTHWGARHGTELYAKMKNKRLHLSKTESAGAVTTITVMETHICVPDYLIEVMGLRRSSPVALILEDDSVTIYPSKMIAMHCKAASADRLLRKLEREFESSKESSIAQYYGALIEDVYMFLILNKWDDDTVQGLLEKPYPLRDLVMEFRNDEEFDSFFERKIKELTISYGANSTNSTD